MPILHAFVSAALLLLSPGRDHTRLGESIERVVTEEQPLFKEDPDRLRTASLVIAVAWREGSLRPDIVGDKGDSFCTMQIHKSSGGTPALLQDTDACVRAGMTMLRKSITVCREHPIAWYASGPKGCGNERAQRISRDRMAMAAWLVRSVKR